jgi:UDP-N-acetylmuramate: L-alanyl-gamma-D-glutamyl-meso-diaminopimelate ligase
MHNLALALHNKGYKVTGSDDAILNHLNHVWIKKGILPLEMGWFPQNHK